MYVVAVQFTHPGRHCGLLAELVDVAETPCSVLMPFAFFVSWQGVITLAFR